MFTSRDQSVGEILDQLLTDELIDACHITGEHVTIVQGTKRHTFPYQQARTFLMGMLRGRSWNLNPGPEDAEEVSVSPLRAVGKSREDVQAASQASRQRITPAPYGSIEPALDEMLDMASHLELIEGHEKDQEDRMVTIILSACQTKMGYEEAVTFLAECVLYKLNTLREEVEFTSSSDRPAAERKANGFPEAQPVWQRLG